MSTVKITTRGWADLCAEIDPDSGEADHSYQFSNGRLFRRNAADSYRSRSAGSYITSDGKTYETSDGLTYVVRS